MPISDLTHLWLDRPLIPASRDLIPPHIMVVRSPEEFGPPYAELAPVQAIIAGPRKYDAAMDGRERPNDCVLPWHAGLLVDLRMCLVACQYDAKNPSKAFHSHAVHR